MNLALLASRLIPRRLGPRAQSAHLIGIAGSGMRALAEVLLAQGWQVTGSDQTPENAARLSAKGIAVFSDHTDPHVTADTGMVVYSDAIGPDNLERCRARQLGLRQLSYPQMLGELMKSRLGMAVAGTHGKSTTTAMAAEILLAAGHDPTVIAGATPLGHASGGRPGRGRPMLVEACEYRRNFLHLSPRFAVVTGIELDHCDCFASLVEVEAAFAEFVARLPSDGTLVANADCPRTLAAARQAASRVVTYGIDCPANWRGVNLVEDRGFYRFEIACPSGQLNGLELRVPGRHNVFNAVAAAALTAQAGADEHAIRGGLTRFAGLERRVEHVGLWDGAVWYDDYAHHPTEIRVALATIRQMFPNRRIWCIFQPHQLSRTRGLLDQFAGSLRGADRVGIAEVYPARESGGAACVEVAAELAERTRRGGARVLHEHAIGRLMDEVEKQIALGDVLLTLGAGDIRNVWHATTGRIRTYRAAG